MPLSRSLCATPVMLFFLLHLAAVFSSDRLKEGERLTLGGRLVSANGKAQLSLQSSDGNLVLYNTQNNGVLWSASTQNKNASYLSLQSDGNLVLYSSDGRSVWASSTNTRDVQAIVQDDCNFVISGVSTSEIHWATWTYCEAPPIPPTPDPLPGDNDRSTLQDKVIAGYQGWFTAEGDGWVHWTSGSSAPADNDKLTFDLWPDTSEYTTLYATGLQPNTESDAKLYSAQDYQTVDTHVRWAKEYGIQGLFLQRFVNELTDANRLRQRNNVLSHLRTACEKYGVTFAVMYDLSGTPEASVEKRILDDWKWIVLQGYATSRMYQQHDGRPLLSVWGWGFSDRQMDVNRHLRILNELRHGLVETYMMAGTPYYWRTGTRDADPAWESFYVSRDLDLISPWAVGRYASNRGFDNLFQGVVLGDLSFIRDRGIGYAPVVWPGFSWGNLKHEYDKYNQIPRNCGDFFKHQIDAHVAQKPTFMYMAMFDEYDEGTAIMKAATRRSQLPSDATFIHLGMDPCGEVPSDHYLRLAGQAYA